MEVPSYLAREPLWGWVKQPWAGALSLAGPAEMQVCFSEAFTFCWTEVSSWPETCVCFVGLRTSMVSGM